MTFKVEIADRARRDIDDWADWMRQYGEDFLFAELDRLERVFSGNLSQAPNRWSYFFLTGPPNRGYLFHVGRRTAYWIVYKVDDDARRVDVLRFWHASRDPKTFSI